MRNCWNYNQNHFFGWDFYSLFFIQRVLKSHLKKITHTESANSQPKSQFDQSHSYINVLKNGSAPSPSATDISVKNINKILSLLLILVDKTLLFWIYREILLQFLWFTEKYYYINRMYFYFTCHAEAMLRNTACLSKTFSTACPSMPKKRFYTSIWAMLDENILAKK